MKKIIQNQTTKEIELNGYYQMVFFSTYFHTVHF